MQVGSIHSHRAYILTQPTATNNTRRWNHKRGEIEKQTFLTDPGEEKRRENERERECEGFLLSENEMCVYVEKERKRQRECVENDTNGKVFSTVARRARLLR